MNKKFVKLYESALSRYTRGGFLAGDVVVFKKDAFNDQWFKGLGVNTQEKIKEMAASGLTLRVSNIKSILPAVMGAGNTDYTTSNVELDITSEIAPGKYMGFVTIPARLVEPVDSYPNLPKVPEVFKKDDPSRRVNIKPKKLKDEAEEIPFISPHSQTRMSDLGDKKLSPGDRELKNANVKIPSSPVKDAKDPASYTYKYLPRK